MAVRNSYFRTSPVGPMYRVGMKSSSLTTATGAILGTTSYAIFSVRWANTDKNMLVSSVKVDWTVTTTFTTIQDLAFGLYKVHGFTADASGGAEATIGTSTYPDMQAFDTNMGPSRFYTAGDFRICTTGALTLTAGQADAWPMHMWTGGPVALIGVSGSQMHYDTTWSPGDRPDTQQFVVRYNEGFIIQPLITMGAAGVLDFFVTVEWAEVAANLS